MGTPPMLALQRFIRAEIDILPSFASRSGKSLLFCDRDNRVEGARRLRINLEVKARLAS
jgi:hypothetical protein